MSRDHADAVEHAEVRRILSSLRSATYGVIFSFEHEVREAVGHTNFNVIDHWLQEAKRVLDREART